jgi:YidC/Oxa1 family membrane protein insertase
VIPVANIFQPLIDVFNGVIVFFHDDIGVGWGLAIILLTLSVRLVLLPLTLKQVTSMQRLAVLAPEMKAIQEKYKADKQRQQQEMMKFYRENRVNPLASCLPLLFQIPFFIGLFYMLKDDLRADICGQTAKACADATAAQFASVGATPGAESFLFISDLTDKATGSVLAVLIVIYVGSQLASGLLSMTSMDRNQRMIMLALPFVFVPFIITFPAGLLVYWITTNLWTIVQQLIVRRTVGTPGRPRVAVAGAPAAAAALAGGGGAKVKEGGRTQPQAQSGNGASARAGPPPSRRKKKRTGRRR